MDNKAIFNVFTKSVLQGLLDKVGGDYRTSWKKDKLIEVLCDFDLETVLNKMSVEQLKTVLGEMKLSETGRKSVLIDRIIGDNAIQKHEELFSHKEQNQLITYLNNLDEDTTLGLIYYFRDQDEYTGPQLHQLFKLQDWKKIGIDTINYDLYDSHGTYNLYISHKTHKNLCILCEYNLGAAGDLYNSTFYFGELNIEEIKKYIYTFHFINDQDYANANYGSAKIKTNIDVK